MSPAQRTAVQHAYTLLGEHFDRVLLVVDYEAHQGTRSFDAHCGYWHGGSMAAIGLAHYALDRILHSGKADIEPP